MAQDFGKQAGCIRKLNATEPYGENRDELMLFGQFVGDWDIVECRYLEGDGSWSITHGEVHCGWILDGMATQDIWMSVDEEEPDMGTTVRFYDPAAGEWNSVWMSQTQKVVIQFKGRRIGDEIVLEANNPAGELIKWIFYDIMPGRFSWRAERYRVTAGRWELYEEMDIRRQKP